MSPAPLHLPSDEEKKLYGEFIAETHKREMASTDNFDKSILTLSSAGLGLSIGFLKDSGGQTVVWPFILYGSWALFVLATLSTMSSFLVSIRALGQGKKVAERGYMKGHYDAFVEHNAWEAWTIRLNYFSAGSFCLALILTIAFVIANVKERTLSTYTTPPSGQLLQKGLTVPTMQLPTSAPSPAPAQPASTPAVPSGATSAAAK